MSEVQLSLVPYTPAGGGSPNPLPILKAQLASALQTALSISLDSAQKLASPSAEFLATAWASGKTYLTPELQWQLEAVVEIANKRLSAQKRAAFLGVIQSAFGVVNFALTGGLSALLSPLAGKVGG